MSLHKTVYANNLQKESLYKVINLNKFGKKYPFSQTVYSSFFCRIGCLISLKLLQRDLQKMLKCLDKYKQLSPKICLLSMIQRVPA